MIFHSLCPPSLYIWNTSSGCACARLFTGAISFYTQQTRMFSLENREQLVRGTVVAQFVVPSLQALLTASTSPTWFRKQPW